MTNAAAGLIAPVFGPVLVARVAASLDIAPESAGTMIRAATPAVLAAFGAKAADIDGARAISELVAAQETDLIGEIERDVDGAGAATLIARGTTMLSSCLGRETIAALANALSSYTGTPQPAAAATLALVTVALVGALGRRPLEDWSTGEGIARLFAPSVGEVEAETPDQPVIEPSPGDTVETLLDDGRRGATWWIAAGLVAVGLVAAVAYFVYPGPQPQPQPVPQAPVASPAAVAPAPVPPPLAPLSAEALRTLDHLTGTFEALGAALAPITDPPTARAAQVKLAAIAADLDMLGDQFAGLPQDVRAERAAMLADAARPLADKVRLMLAQPDLKAVLKPVAGPLLARLDGFAAP